MPSMLVHARPRSRPRLGPRVAAALATLTVWALTAAGAAAAATSQRTLRLYAVATAAQFVNHSDDRARGAAINPFNADTKSLVPAANAKEKGKGPYPGDDALYSFNLYDAASLSHRIGTATLTCVYNFSQHATCEASIQTTSGTMFASGPADFTAATVTLAVTGGSGTYLGARGQLTTNNVTQPRSKDEERFDFTLT
jgi:hypothetical protein